MGNTKNPKFNLKDILKYQGWELPYPGDKVKLGFKNGDTTELSKDVVYKVYSVSTDDIQLAEKKGLSYKASQFVLVERAEPGYWINTTFIAIARSEK